MKTLNDYVVLGALYRDGTGVEAQVGDQVKLFLDQDSIPTLPEYIIGVIQHPIVKTECQSSTSYRIEYDETDLPAEVEFLRVAYIIDATITTTHEVLEAAYLSLESALDAETAARISADSTLQDNIDAEEAARISADSTLQDNIDAEESARISADGTLQDNIDAEAAARIAADDLLMFKPLVQVNAPDSLVGNAQIERLSPTGTVTVTGDAIVSITLAALDGSPRAYAVPVSDTDGPAEICASVHAVLSADADLTALVDVTNNGTSVDLSTKEIAGAFPANDPTFLITIFDSTSSGVDTVSSTNQQAGVATIEATDPEVIGRWCRVGAAPPYEWYQADTLTSWKHRFTGDFPATAAGAGTVLGKLVSYADKATGDATADVGETYFAISENKVYTRLA